jgi:hypothetical protein
LKSGCCSTVARSDFEKMITQTSFG